MVAGERVLLGFGGEPLRLRLLLFAAVTQASRSQRRTWPKRGMAELDVKLELEV